ncbi:MAG: RNA polymerase sigma factor [Bryobacterales bacterium]|nr:RNA polymerase sigma factor [Bryobacterales bacterium]
MASGPSENPESFSSTAHTLNDVQLKEFEQVYREEVDHVFRYAMGCTGRREVAEEIASETFLALYRNFPGVDASWRKAWLLRVAKNLAVNHWRKRQRERELPEHTDLPGVSGIPESAESILDHEALKPAHRACLILRYVHGMEREEIVAATGMSLNQVKSCLQYGLKLLRDKFQIDGKGGPHA